MNKIILLERYNPSSFVWPNLIKRKNLTEFSMEETLEKYQGFEGDLSLSFQFSEDMEEFKNKGFCNGSLLCVVSGDHPAPFFLTEKATQVGYDVGVCEEENTMYSSIFNEILFGKLDELVVWKNFLNENLLFSDKTLAEKYVNLHNKLSTQGKDVEDYAGMIIYEIWKL